MNNILSQMLAEYPAQSMFDREHAIKEIVQEIVLCGLSRSGFFDKAAFYGGTALRIFFGIDRFSEDMDFSLMVPDESFTLDEYIPMLEREVNSYGLNVSIENKEKTKESAIRSAFLKANTVEHMLLFYGDTMPGIHGDQKIKIKLEIDTQPPMGAGFEHKYRLLPTPHEVNIFDETSLFAGKIHAVLCRGWKNRVKGRDLYDYVFYLSRKTPYNLKHLKSRLVQSGAIFEQDPFDELTVREMLVSRFESINYKQAREDVIPFIKDSRSLDVWSADFFMQITENLCSGGDWQ